MRRGRVLNLSVYNKLINFIIKNKQLIILTVFFIFGFIFAVFTYGKYKSVADFSAGYMQKFISDRAGVSFLKIAAHSFGASLFYIVICFAGGTSMLGVVLVPLAVFSRAFIYGTVAAYLYSAYSFNGVAFHAVILLLPAVFFIIGFIISAIESVNFSLKLASSTFFANAKTDFSFEFRRYCIRYILICFFVLLSSLADALLSTNFLDNLKL